MLLRRSNTYASLASSLLYVSLCRRSSALTCCSAQRQLMDSQAIRLPPFHGNFLSSCRSASNGFADSDTNPKGIAIAVAVAISVAIAIAIGHSGGVGTAVQRHIRGAMRGVWVRRAGVRSCV